MATTLGVLHAPRAPRYQPSLSSQSGGAKSTTEQSFLRRGTGVLASSPSAHLASSSGVNSNSKGTRDAITAAATSISQRSTSYTFGSGMGRIIKSPSVGYTTTSAHVRAARPGAGPDSEISSYSIKIDAAHSSNAAARPSPTHPLNMCFGRGSSAVEPSHSEEDLGGPDTRTHTRNPSGSSLLAAAAATTTAAFGTRADNGSVTARCSSSSSSGSSQSSVPFHSRQSNLQQRGASNNYTMSSGSSSSSVRGALLGGSEHQPPHSISPRQRGVNSPVASQQQQNSAYSGKFAAGGPTLNTVAIAAERSVSSGGGGDSVTMPPGSGGVGSSTRIPLPRRGGSGAVPSAGAQSVTSYADSDLLHRSGAEGTAGDAAGAVAGLAISAASASASRSAHALDFAPAGWVSVAGGRHSSSSSSAGSGDERAGATSATASTTASAGRLQPRAAAPPLSYALSGDIIAARRAISSGSSSSGGGNTSRAAATSRIAAADAAASAAGLPLPADVPGFLGDAAAAASPRAATAAHASLDLGSIAPLCSSSSSPLPVAATLSTVANVLPRSGSKTQPSQQQRALEWLGTAATHSSLSSSPSLSSSSSLVSAVVSSFSPRSVDQTAAAAAGQQRPMTDSATPVTTAGASTPQGARTFLPKTAAYFFSSRATVPSAAAAAAAVAAVVPTSTTPPARTTAVTAVPPLALDTRSRSERELDALVAGDSAASASLAIGSAHLAAAAAPSSSTSSSHALGMGRAAPSAQQRVPYALPALPYGSTPRSVSMESAPGTDRSIAASSTIGCSSSNGGGSGSSIGGGDSSARDQQQRHQTQQQLQQGSPSSSGTSTSRLSAMTRSLALSTHRPGHTDTAAASTTTTAAFVAAAAASSSAHFSATPARGIVGLSNLGNTCFMNSVLQCLSHVPPLRRYFTRGHYAALPAPALAARTRTAVTGEFSDLVAAMWSVPSVTAHSDLYAQPALSPARLKRAIAAAAPRFDGYDQHDSHELLSFLIDALVEGTNAVRAKLPYVELDDPAASSDVDTASVWWAYHTSRAESAVWALFAGQGKTVVTCGECGGASRAFDPFLDLQVPLPQTTHAGSALTLGRCIDALMAPEQLLGSETAYCRRCRTHRPSTKETALFRLPGVLVVQLKRFTNAGWRRSKLEAPVEFPLKGLDVRRWCDPESPYVSDSVYDCVAVSNHSGGLGGGHYTADAVSCDNGKWFQFNDSRVSHSALDGCEVSSRSAAYVLFYVKRSLLQAGER